MTIKIGAKIKSLRKKADVTQDRLAEYLGVTAQAISRWESEICYPDIETLPGIADFFDISLDGLIGIDEKQKVNKINEYIEKANEAQCSGKFAEAVAIYREAVSRYPSSCKLQAFLACAIGCMDNGEKIPIDLANEAISICNRVLEDCVEDTIRWHALSIQCWIYSRQLYDMDKAMEVAEKFPRIYNSVEFVQAETLNIRMPSKKAEEAIYSYVGAMLITFNKTEISYSNNKKVMLEALIEELSTLLAGVSG